MVCDHGMMLMGDHDDAYVDAMLMVNMQANTRSVTQRIWEVKNKCYSLVLDDRQLADLAF